MADMESREIELRVFDVNAEQAREHLVKMGAQVLGTMHFKRAVLDVNPIDPNKWIRLRTEGDKTTLAVKQRISGAADGTGEVEVTVDDFDKTLQLLQLVGGYEPRSIQESHREAFSFGDAEISIDSWPQIPNFMEIEAPTEAELRSVARELGVEAQLTGDSVENYYLQNLGIDIKHTSIRFE